MQRLLGGPHCQRLLLACIGFLLLLLQSSCVEDEQLIGWLGETYPDRAHHDADKDSGMVVLSWEPRIFWYKNFLSKEETDHIKKWAEPRLQRSAIADPENGARNVSSVRTSSGVFIMKGHDKVVQRIEQRISMWTMLAVDNGEDMNILRYQEGQKYDPHHDYFSFKGRDGNGGNRMCTVLMYLSDVEEGGETVFPLVAPLEYQSLAESGFSDCAKKGLAIKPRRGHAIAFWSIKPSGAFDYKSLHGACPVLKGQKWSMTKWIRVGAFGSGQTVLRTIYEAPPPPVPPGCIDNNKMCEIWAEAGECERNPKFMVGTKAEPGQCLASCSRCELMPKL